MIKELMYKWFGLDPIPCASCEVLRPLLEKSEIERRELLHLLLEKDKPEPPIASSVEEPVSIGVKHIPWRVRQQMLESEDRQQAALLKKRAKEISELEKELDIPIGNENAS